MHLPSLRYISKKTTSALKRFPLALLSAAIVVAFSIYLIEFPDALTDNLYRIILVALLGIPLFTVLPLIGEKNGWTRLYILGSNLLGVCLLVLYCFLLPTDLDMAPYSHVYRYVLYIIGLHLLVAIGPYWSRTEVNAFWQYNKTLFLRFLTAVFFSGVLFAGLSIALLSIDVLLGISIEEERYFELFIILGGIFNTWFFLAGIPDLQTFNRVETYPKGLKIFTQNILIPLVTTYLVILYLYIGKIVLEWSWPEGWVAILVLSFCITGIFALLLLHPIKDKVENCWIRQFSTSYFWALVPLVILLLMAIYRRVEEYGITVERYFVIILGLWLAGVVIYFILSKTKNIKVIPGSLCILAFLISFGPWGAFSFSERSQVNRLEHYLKQNDILQNGAIQKISQPIPNKDEQQINSIIRYLNDTHGLNGLQPWFKQDLSSLTTHTNNQDSTSVQPVNHYNRPQYIVELMGLKYTSNGYAYQGTNRHEFYTDRNDVLEVNNVTWIIQNMNWSSQNDLKEYQTGDEFFVIESSDKAPHIRIYWKSGIGDTLTINLAAFITKLQKQHASYDQKIPAGDMTWISLNNVEHSIHAKIYFNHISWKNEEGQIIPENAQFSIGLK